MTISETPAPRQEPDDEAAVSPDSPETRLRILEEVTARLRQRMDDLLERLAGQFKDLDGDIKGLGGDVRAFAPIVREVDAVKSELRFITSTQRDLQNALGDLRMQMEKESKERREGQERERKERADGQEKRAKESRTLRTAVIVAAIGLTGTFLSSVAVVVAALL